MVVGEWQIKETRWGPLSRAVCEFYANLRNVKHDDPELEKATKFAQKVFRSFACCPSKKKRASGGGRKPWSPGCFIFLSMSENASKGVCPRKCSNSRRRSWMQIGWHIIPRLCRSSWNLATSGSRNGSWNLKLVLENQRNGEDGVERIQDYLRNIWLACRLIVVYCQV